MSEYALFHNDDQITETRALWCDAISDASKKRGAIFRKFDCEENRLVWALKDGYEVKEVVGDGQDV